MPDLKKIFLSRQIDKRLLPPVSGSCSSSDKEADQVLLLMWQAIIFPAVLLQTGQQLGNTIDKMILHPDMLVAYVLCLCISYHVSATSSMPRHMLRLLFSLIYL